MDDSDSGQQMEPRIQDKSPIHSPTPQQFPPNGDDDEREDSVTQQSSRKQSTMNYDNSVPIVKVEEEEDVMPAAGSSIAFQASGADSAYYDSDEEPDEKLENTFQNKNREQRIALLFENSDFDTDVNPGKTNTVKEDVVLEFVNHFREQFEQLFPSRPPLLLSPFNEYGTKKFISTYIGPVLLPYTELYSYESCANFVFQYLTYEPLPNPHQLPETLASPATTLMFQKGDCFEISLVLVSLLLGAGYNAFVVFGYADKDFANNLQEKNTCPVKPELEIEKKNEGKKYLRGKYSKLLKTRPQHISNFQYLNIDIANNEENLKKIGAHKDDPNKPQTGDKSGKNSSLGVNGPMGDGIANEVFTADESSIHCWVMILPSERGITKPIFIETSTGKCYDNIKDTKKKPEQESEEEDELPYKAIISVANNENYWVNMQTVDLNDSNAPLKQIKNMNFELNNLRDWEKIFIPLELGGELGSLNKSGSKVSSQNHPSRSDSAKSPSLSKTTTPGGAIVSGKNDAENDSGDNLSNGFNNEFYNNEMLLQTIEEGELDDEVLDLPRKSWGRPIFISSKQYESRYPGKKKKIEYRNATLELFAPFLRKDLLIKRLTFYADEETKQEISEQHCYYTKRFDKLTRKSIYRTKFVETEPSEKEKEKKLLEIYEHHKPDPKLFGKVIEEIPKVIFYLEKEKRKMKNLKTNNYNFKKNSIMEITNQNPNGFFAREWFAPGRKDGNTDIVEGVREIVTEENKKRIFRFYSNSRLDGLEERFEFFIIHPVNKLPFLAKVKEKFKGRSDKLCFRSVIFDIKVEKIKPSTKTTNSLGSSPNLNNISNANLNNISNEKSMKNSGGSNSSSSTLLLQNSSSNVVQNSNSKQMSNQLMMHHHLEKTEIKRMIKLMKEKFERNSTKHFDDDSAVKYYFVEENRFLVKRHYGKDKIWESSTEFDDRDVKSKVVDILKKTDKVNFILERNQLILSQKQCEQEILKNEKEIIDIIQRRKKEEDYVTRQTSIYDVSRNAIDNEFGEGRGKNGKNGGFDDDIDPISRILKNKPSNEITIDDVMFVFDELLSDIQEKYLLMRQWGEMQIALQNEAINSVKQDFNQTTNKGNASHHENASLNSGGASNNAGLVDDTKLEERKFKKRILEKGLKEISAKQDQQIALIVKKLFDDQRFKPFKKDLEETLKQKILSISPSFRSSMGGVF